MTSARQHMLRRFVLIAFVLVSSRGIVVAQEAPEAAVGGGLEAERQRLLELHEQQRTAHLEKDPDLLVSMLADDFVSIEDGVVERLGREVLRRRFESYFAAVEFLEWSDLAPPEIALSEDGTLATVVVQKRVRLRPAAESDAAVEETQFAWLETWRKRRGRWELIALASTQGEAERLP